MLKWLMIFSASMVAAVQAAEIHVSPHGRDADPGTRQKPCLTLERARDAARGNKGAVSIVLHGGVYRLMTSLELDERDSNTVWLAADGEEPCITGGLSVSAKDLKPIAEPSILKRIPEPTRGKVLELVLPGKGPGGSESWPLSFRGYAGWPEVYVDGKPMRLARWPNNGYATIDKVLDAGSKAGRGDKSGRCGKFTFREPNPTAWRTDEPIYLGGYWCYKWFDEFLRVESIDVGAKQINMAASHRYGLGGPSKGLYFAINLLEELDQPGEYVYDGKRNALYMFLPEDNGANLTVSLLRQTLVAARKTKDLKFSGITFENGCGNAIELSDCETVRIEDCSIRQMSGTGVVVENGKDCGIDRVHILTMGKSGVRLKGGDRQTLTPSKHFVINSRIHDYARLVRTYCPAVGVKGVGQLVSNNHFYDAPHQAVQFSGNDHQIIFNHIERVCLDTADAGAIYCGRDWTMGGNRVHGNYIHDLGGATHNGNWGIYLDDMASGIEVSSNLVADTASGFLIGGGRQNIITDNVIVNCPRKSIRFDARGAGWVSKTRDWLNKPDGTMWKRLGELPYKTGIWAERFPYLAKIENDGYKEPRRNIVAGNRMLRSPAIDVDKLVAKYGTVTNNAVSDISPEIVIEEGHMKISHPGLASFEALKIGPSM